MATYRLVRRRGPIEVPTPAPQAQPEPERNLGGGEPHVWIDYGPPGAQCSRCGVDRDDSGGMSCIPRAERADRFFSDTGLRQTAVDYNGELVSPSWMATQRAAMQGRLPVREVLDLFGIAPEEPTHSNPEPVPDPPQPRTLWEQLDDDED